jgi:hypothetical protein
MINQNNERFRNTYIWTLEEEMKKKDTEIVRLRVQNEKMREALRNIADATHSDWFSMRKIARAALKGDE